MGVPTLTATISRSRESAFLAACERLVAAGKAEWV